MKACEEHSSSELCIDFLQPQGMIQRGHSSTEKIYILADRLISGIEEDSLKRISSENLKQEKKIITSIFSCNLRSILGSSLALKYSTSKSNSDKFPKIDGQKRLQKMGLFRYFPLICLRVSDSEQDADMDAIVPRVKLSCFIHWARVSTSIEVVEGPSDVEWRKTRQL
ncbi:hypothetical protein SDJN03_06387, partial [Cucurbita argyrosperma subsp. sororia]